MVNSVAYNLSQLASRQICKLQSQPVRLARHFLVVLRVYGSRKSNDSGYLAVIWVNYFRIFVSRQSNTASSPLLWSPLVYRLYIFCPMTLGASHYTGTRSSPAPPDGLWGTRHSIQMWIPGFGFSSASTGLGMDHSFSFPMRSHGLGWDPTEKH